MGKILTFKLLLFAVVALLISYFALSLKPSRFLDRFDQLSTPSPPPLSGALDRNSLLSRATRVFENETIAPSSLVFRKGDLYMTVAGGQLGRIHRGQIQLIAKLSDNNCSTEMMQVDPFKCGEPVGLRLDAQGIFFVADRSRGLFAVEIASNMSTVKRILSPESSKGRKTSFLTDIAIQESKENPGVEVLYMSYTQTSNEKQTGGVLKYEVKTKKVTVVAEFDSPASVEITSEGNALLISESSKREIWKHHLQGFHEGKSEILVSNLPGLPQHIRRSGDLASETYWVPLSCSDSPKIEGFYTNMIQKLITVISYTTNSAFQYLGRTLNSQFLRSLTPTVEMGKPCSGKMGIILEMNSRGQIIGSLQSPRGETSQISEVLELRGRRKERILFLSSNSNKFLGRLVIQNTISH